MESVSVPSVRGYTDLPLLVPESGKSGIAVPNSGYIAIHAVYVWFTAEICFLVTLLSDKAFSCGLELAQKSSLFCNIHILHIHV